MVYKRRWQIEVLFEALKSRGFNFEETRLREAKRLETLCGVLAIAFCWAWYVGAGDTGSNRLRSRRHQRPAKSLFRYGFDGIRQPVPNAADQWQQLERILSLLQKVLTSPKALLHPLYPRIILSCTVCGDQWFESKGTGQIP